MVKILISLHLAGLRPAMQAFGLQKKIAFSMAACLAIFVFNLGSQVVANVSDLTNVVLHNQGDLKNSENVKNSIMMRLEIIK